jgi:hypothetical protein
VVVTPLAGWSAAGNLCESRGPSVTSWNGPAGITNGWALSSVKCTDLALG